MRSILVLLEDLVRSEFGSGDLAAVRAVAASRLGTVGVGDGPVGRVSAFVRALSEVRRRPLPEVYIFVGMRLVPSVVKDVPTNAQEPPSTRQVLLQLDQCAPPILDSLLPGVQVPSFDVELIDVEALRISFVGADDAASALEGVVHGLGLHFGERVEVRRVTPPSYAPDRRLLDVKITAERRTEEVASPVGVERRRFFPF
jgi:hypothetical protein